MTTIFYIVSVGSFGWPDNPIRLKLSFSSNKRILYWYTRHIDKKKKRKFLLYLFCLVTTPKIPDCIVGRRSSSVSQLLTTICMLSSHGVLLRPISSIPLSLSLSLSLSSICRLSLFAAKESFWSKQH